jgi:hypothetical protein
VSAEALSVLKLLFFRSKDLADLEQLVAVQGSGLDHAWVRSCLVSMLGEAWDRIVRTHGPSA